MGDFPDVATLEAALDTAARAPSIKNSQPWRWRVGRGGLDLYADWSRQLGSTESDRREVLLSCGVVLDHCVVALAARGWRPKVRRLPDPDDTGHLALIEVVEQPPGPGSVELAGAVRRRRADRRPYRDTPIPAATLELLYIRARRLQVRLGVVPKDRWNRLDLGTIGLRYDMGLRNYPEPAAADGLRGDDAAMLVLGTDTDDDLMRLRAGEALSHLLLSATAMGLATCPLTEPLQNERDRLMLACEVFDGEAHPQALIRLGWAPADGGPPAPVERRPLSETTTWDRDLRDLLGH